MRADTERIAEDIAHDLAARIIRIARPEFTEADFRPGCRKAAPAIREAEHSARSSIVFYLVWKTRENGVVTYCKI